MPILFGCPDSALEESLYWLLSIQSYLTELRLIMPHLGSDLQLNMEIKLRGIATVLHNLQEQRRVRAVSNGTSLGRGNIDLSATLAWPRPFNSIDA